MAVKPILWEFSIGGVQLTKFSAPEEFEIGWEKQLVEHKTLTPNGVSRIDTHILGIYPIPTTWPPPPPGINALNNFQQLERLATQPADVMFIYGPLQYNVQVSKVTGHPKSPIEIAYDLSITVKSVITENGAIPSNTPPFDISTQTFIDNGDAAWTALGSSPSLPASLEQAYNNQKAQQAAASPLRDAPFPVLVLLAKAVQVFNQAMYAYLAAQELKRLDATGNTALLNALTVYTNYSQYYSNLQTLLGGEIGNQQIVAEANTNLFAIAQQFYPNLDAASGANMIAQANKLADYFITSRVMLTIPAPTS